MPPLPARLLCSRWYGDHPQLWAIYFRPEQERDAIDSRLKDYLTPDAVRKSYAFLQGERLEFAQNTRDVSRHLGDLIRWKLGLPPRPGIATLKNKLLQVKMVVPAHAA